MQGKLMTKSKVIQTERPKSQVYRRRIKPERASTPQRWSRRIRSLPPIPINVLKPHRKNRKKCTNYKEERPTSTVLQEFKESNFPQKVNRERRKTVFVNKTQQVADGDSVEVVRIVPVVVYIKNPVKPNKTFSPDEIRVHINDSPTCRLVSHAIGSHIYKKRKQASISMGKRYSKRIRTAHHSQVENMVQAAKKKCSSRKKLLLYH